MKSTALNRNSVELVIGDVNACGIEIVIHLGVNLQARLGRGGEFDPVAAVEPSLS